MALSNAQIDRLGDRLRTQEVTDADLRLLDEHRASFSSSYEQVIQTIESQLGLNPTGRQAKTTASIIAKLKRETGIRLSRMQDIAGCRIIVSSITAQDQAMADLSRVFRQCKMVDRRKRPSHGYRAVHVVIGLDSKQVEVQIRTGLQQVWAELSEKLSDNDPDVKYGGGNEKSRKILANISDFVTTLEESDPESTHDPAVDMLQTFLQQARGLQ
jgi:putative GTP pyrophosphokinase